MGEVSAGVKAGSDLWRGENENSVQTAFVAHFLLSFILKNSGLSAKQQGSCEPFHSTEA